MTQNRKREAARKIIAAMSVLSVSLGVATAAPSQQLSGNASDAADAHGPQMKIAEAKAKIQSNQFKWRNPAGSRRNVRPGEKNTLSPQPLPPGGGRSQ